MVLRAGMLLLVMFVLQLLAPLCLRVKYLLLFRDFVFLLLEIMFLLLKVIFLLMEFLMGHLMGFFTDHIMGRSMDRFIHLMGTGINNPFTL